jgi:hypothetical protein
METRATSVPSQRLHFGEKALGQFYGGHGSSQAAATIASFALFGKGARWASVELPRLNVLPFRGTYTALIRMTARHLSALLGAANAWL